MGQSASRKRFTVPHTLALVARVLLCSYNRGLDLVNGACIVNLHFELDPLEGLYGQLHRCKLLLLLLLLL